MRKKELENFLGAYLRLMSLVVKMDTSKVILTLCLYALSVLLMMITFFLVLALVKSLITLGGLDLSTDIEMDVAFIKTKMNATGAAASLGGAYFLSSIFAAFTLIYWHRVIESILVRIVENQKESLDKKRLIKLRQGGVASMRVSNMILTSLFPITFAGVSFVLLLVINPMIALVVLIILLITYPIYRRLGIDTKNLAKQIKDPDLDLGQDKASPDSMIRFLSTFFQLKAKSALTSNLLFGSFLFVVFLYINSITDSPDQLYETIVTCFLLFMIFTGFREGGTKLVPLARLYPVVAEFIQLIESK